MSLIYVKPPDDPVDSDVWTGCGLCGVEVVAVDGDRPWTEEHPVMGPCGVCEGHGAIEYTMLRGIRDESEPITKVVEERCHRCDGSGRAWTRRVRTVTLTARDLDPDVLARRHWTPWSPSRKSLHLTGGGRVALWLCPTCEEMRRQVGAFGPPLVANLLHEAGFTRYRPDVVEIVSIRRITFAGRVIDARDDGFRREPEPNPTPWAHMADADFQMLPTVWPLARADVP